MTTSKIFIQDELTGNYYGVKCSENPKGFLTSASDEGNPGDNDFSFWTTDADEAYDFGTEQLANSEMGHNDLTYNGTRKPVVITVPVTTFSVTTYYDPYGDSKSTRKVLSRKFYHTLKTKEDVEAVFQQRVNAYYNGVNISFKSYKKTARWSGFAF